MAAAELCTETVGDEELYDSPRKRKEAASPKTPYYLRNFLAILNHVLQNAHNWSLFSEQELSLLRSFSDLQEASQQLYVRLFLRSHRWFKASKLSYPQISSDLQLVLDDLIRTHFLLGETQLEDLPVVLDLLQLPELKQLCKELKLSSSSKQSQTKASLTQLLLRHARQHRPLFASAPSSSAALLKKAKCVLGHCVKVSPSPRQVFQKCVLLFSLESTLVNEEDEQSQGQQLVFRMLEADVGRTTYPDYDIIVTKPLFSSAEEFTRYCAAYDCKQNMLSASEGGRMEEVVSIARECISALSASIREEEEEEVWSKRQKLDALLGKLCHRAHVAQSPAPAKAALTAPPSAQDDVIVLSDSDNDDIDAREDEGDRAEQEAISECASTTCEEMDEKVAEKAPQPSFTASANRKQVTLFDCCTAAQQEEKAGRHQKANNSFGCGEQDKSGTTASVIASLKCGRGRKMSLSLHRKQLQQLEPKLIEPSPAIASSREKTGPFSGEGGSITEQLSKYSRPGRRLQPMRAAKRLKLVMDQAFKEEDVDDEEDCSISACSSNPLQHEPKQIKSSPVSDARGRFTRARTSSISTLANDDEDCEDFDPSPKYSSPLRKQPRRAMKKEDHTEYDASPKYSSPLCKQPRRAVKRLNFGADSRNGLGVDGKSSYHPISTEVIELDSGASPGSSGQSSTVNMEHTSNLEWGETETPQCHATSVSGRDGETSSACRDGDSPGESAAIVTVALRSSTKDERPLQSTSSQCTSEGPPSVSTTRPPPTSLAQSYSPEHQSSTHAPVNVDSPSDSFQQLLAGEVYVRVLSHAVEYLEKQRRYCEACALLQYLLAQNQHGLSKRGIWFDRLALNLDFHLKKQSEALDTILQGLSDPSLHPGHKHSLHHRATRICRSHKWEAKLEQLPNMEVQPIPEKEVLASNHPHKQRESYALFVHPSSPSHDDYRMVSVEQFALEHYRTEEGWSRGVHAEGSTFSTLFALLFWDIIFFHSVPDVFRSQYQGLPLDFLSPAFYKNRQSAVDERLKWIVSATTEEVSCLVAERWREFEGQQCSIVTWSLVPSANEVKSLTSCIGGEVLAKVCAFFSTQPYSHYRGGLPDLTLWDPESGRSKFVEVKGPTDRLSSKQVLWLNRLVQWGCEAEVCKVKVKR